ncbi:hypothetical protein DF268_38835 [Streptomyces sp. V2]|uniref:Lipoprotein n=1 Tax=Streptomyces niveiscabiei TaxID=164115 RepID=A0ABW9I0C0_9ACTN|nr:hypothetical protein [Streptomyces sp. V2]PWG08257.1 hypothetical protein DF268_38835 [Streptomyces sp. V2]
MRIRAAITTTTALLALTTLAACSSSDDNKAAPSTPTVSTPSSEPSSVPSSEPTPVIDPAQESTLRQTVQDYTEAYFRGDAEVGYDTLSTRCKKKISAEAYQAVVKQAAAEYGPQIVTELVIDELSGPLARVSYGVGLPKFDQTKQPWALEGTAWKYDAC